MYGMLSFQDGPGLEGQERSNQQDPLVLLTKKPPHHGRRWRIPLVGIAESRRYGNSLAMWCSDLVQRAEPG